MEPRGFDLGLLVFLPCWLEGAPPGAGCSSVSCAVGARAGARGGGCRPKISKNQHARDVPAITLPLEEEEEETNMVD